MADQFDTYLKLLALKQKNPTVAGMREAITAAGIAIVEDDPIPGYYRSAATKGGPLLPIAIWQEGNILYVMRGDDLVEPEKVWPFCVWSPVSFDDFEAAKAGKGWPDADATVTEQANARAQIGGNNPPEDPAEILKEQIEAAKAGVTNYAKIEDDETAAKAQSLRSRLLELRRDADKTRKKLNDPHDEAIEKINDKWMPLAKMAKEAADAIALALGAWETAKAKKAAEEQRKREEEARQAAQKAAAEGKPAEEAPAPTPPPAQPTTIKGGYGRAATIKVAYVAQVTDQDAAYQHFKNIPEVQQAIQRCAQRAVDAGHKDIPGVTIDEQRKVA